MGSGAEAEPLELGVFRPQLVPVKQLVAGEVGYVATGLKNVREAQVGDTVTTAARPASEPLPGYQPAKSLVFAGIYPVSGEDYPLLREALEKLHLNDASFTYEPESSVALGFGFRCGFLGLLHMEIVQERLEREFALDLIASAPSVEYHVEPDARPGHGRRRQPGAAARTRADIEAIEEPWVKLSVVTPSALHRAADGALDQPARDVRERWSTSTRPGSSCISRCRWPSSSSTTSTSSRAAARATPRWTTRSSATARPTSSRSTSSSTASRSTRCRSSSTATGRRPSAASWPSGSSSSSRARCSRSRSRRPIGSNVIARESVRAMRKNVLAKCYGGDITRKRKLLEKQKEGKQRMKRVGSVEIPQEAFLAMLRMDEG